MITVIIVVSIVGGFLKLMVVLARDIETEDSIIKGKGKIEEKDS